MQVIGQVARFQAAPKKTHIIAVKRIFKYLKGTMDFGLWYPKGNELTLISFSNVDLEGCVDDRRSTSRTTFFVGDYLVSWSRKKHSLVCLSTHRSRKYSSDSFLYSYSLNEENPARHTHDM